MARVNQRTAAMATAGRRGTQAIAAGRRVGVTVLFVLLLALLCSAVAQAAPGALDTTFGLGGETQVPFPGLARAGALALTPDGGSVVAGFDVVPGCGCNEYALARFTADGVLDPTFGSGGTETLGTTANIAGGVVVEPDERIVVTGTGNGDTTVDFVTERLNPDGTVDTSFGTGGTSTVDFGAKDEAFAMAQQPDGKLVIVGATGTQDANGIYTAADFAITRLNADGSLDTSFGAGGKQTVDFGGVDEAEGVAVQPDGKIVVTGFGGAGHDLVATRLNADGTVDTSFGTGGKTSINFGGTESGGAMALQPDGKILIVGATDVSGASQFAVARLTAGGALDPSFNGSGMLTLAYGPKAAAAVAVQQNGKIVVLGDGGAGQDFIVARLNPDGSQDTSFGTGGAADVDFGLDEEDGSVALQPDGKIVLAGSSGSDDANGNLVTGDFAIARLLGDPVTSGGTGGGGTGGGGTGGGGTGTGGGVAVPQPPIARLSVAPRPTCVGVPTRLDGSASTPGSGGLIVNYRFSYYETSVIGIRDTNATVLGNSATSAVTAEFPWSHEALAVSRVFVLNWVRAPAVVTLTVTVASGRTSSITAPVAFAQTSSASSAAACPPLPTGTNAPATAALPQVSVSPSQSIGAAISSQLNCNLRPGPLARPCTGDIVISTPSLPLEMQDEQDYAKEMQLKKDLAEAEAESGAGSAAVAQAKAAVDQARAAIDAILKKEEAIFNNSGFSFKVARIASVKVKPRRPYIFAAAPYRLAVGQKARLSITLDRSARNILSRYHRLRVTLSTVGIAPDGAHRVSSRTVILHTKSNRPSKKTAR
jgi:uncharacterized delta-60 repeat protein